MQSLDAASARVTSDWVYGELKAIRIASKRLLKCGGVVGFVDDTSRHGKPAEVTNMGILWDARASRAAYLPPMVPVGTEEEG